MERNLLTEVFQAYFDARKNKRTTASQLTFELNLEHNLVVLYEEIRDRRYYPSPCYCFISEEPVKREIFASPFRDRVVHHLLYNTLMPIFDPLFIYDSYSCRLGKGTLQGIRRFEHHIRSCSDNYTRNAYILKMDLQGYFMSIDKRKLYEMITETISAKASKYNINVELTDYLVRCILFRDPTEGCSIIGALSDWDGLPASKSLLKSPKGVGLPIGDLTSQLFSNIYLNKLDQYVKQTLRCRHYGRYVDDFYIVHENKEHLKSLVSEIRTFLKEELFLTLHPRKVSITHCSKGVNFLGAYILPYRRLPSRRIISSVNNIVKKSCMSHILVPLTTIKSYVGYLSHFRAYHLTQLSLNIMKG